VCFHTPGASTRARLNRTSDPAIGGVRIHRWMHEMVAPHVSALRARLGRSRRARHFSDSWHESAVSGHLTPRIHAERRSERRHDAGGTRSAPSAPLETGRSASFIIR
jgi:hypothetical protein